MITIQSTLSPLNLDISIVANRGLKEKINNKMANSVDPDKTANYAPSNLDLHCFQRYLCWSVQIKG